MPKENPNFSHEGFPFDLHPLDNELATIRQVSFAQPFRSREQYVYDRVNNRQVMQMQYSERPFANDLLSKDELTELGKDINKAAELAERYADADPTNTLFIPFQTSPVAMLIQRGERNGIKFTHEIFAEADLDNSGPDRRIIDSNVSLTLMAYIKDSIAPELTNPHNVKHMSAEVKEGKIHFEFAFTDSREKGYSSGNFELNQISQLEAAILRWMIKTLQGSDHYTLELSDETTPSA